jgi:glutamate dehydrogenase
MLSEHVMALCCHRIYLRIPASAIWGRWGKFQWPVGASMNSSEQDLSFLASYEASCRAAAKSLGAAAAAGFSQFCALFKQDLAPEDWANRPADEGAACLLAIWRRLQMLPPGERFMGLVQADVRQYGGSGRRAPLLVLQADMPFLVDSLRLAFNRLGLPIYLLKSAVLAVERTPEGQLQASANPFERGRKESLIYVETRLLDDQQWQALASELVEVFEDIAVMVQDYGALTAAVTALEQELSRANRGDSAEAQAFLRWLKSGHFTFMGLRHFTLVQRGKQQRLDELDSARLGVFRHLGASSAGQWGTGMAAFYTSDELVAFSKSSTRCKVHRQVYPDYIVVKRFNEKGQLVGETRLLGLFTYPVYTLSPFDIPLVRAKVAQVMNGSGFDAAGHQGKNLRRVIENYPRDELFQSRTDDLLTSLLGVARINERRVVRLFFRFDPFGRFVTVVAYIPRDLYNTQLRLAMESLIGKALASVELDSTTHFSESILARAQMVFRLSPDSPTQVDTAALEEAVRLLARSWTEALAEMCGQIYDESECPRLLNRYLSAFPSSYQASFSAQEALADMCILEAPPEGPLWIDIQRDNASPDRYWLKLFHPQSALTLSDVVPLLERLGLQVLGEHSYVLQLQSAAGAEAVHLHRFSLRAQLAKHYAPDTLAGLFKPAFVALLQKRAESDGFNRLILAAGISWREVLVLRAYAGYLKQTLFPFTADAMADALLKHLPATQALVGLFHSQFNPAQAKAASAQTHYQQLLTYLDTLDNLTEDRILRRYADLMRASLRTNFYQTLPDGSPKPYLSIKLAPRQVADIPEPRPAFEIYVYSPRVEGVHLRTSRVARGGLRWSDRLQDYRTEVLGLVKAQQVKNAVIVPSGAKGGFVPKQMPEGANRDQQQQEAIECYRWFIRGLLDLTDNYSNGQLSPPPQVVALDPSDPYLVVAADKGTASFSDIANALSADYQHWLGDAFASGGSQGYDHKGMGITAKGGWVAVERHFREQGRSTFSAEFTLVGIGDMSGDVFGNGLLISRHAKLVAAFNHQHIFIDPHPDPETSYRERERLFRLPRSSWADYDPALISTGGGVFLRSTKSIAITPAMREVLAIEADKLAPTDLIAALLKAPVDLIWNGGIGTYVKASTQSQGEIGDKANDALRVNGNELRCKVFGEGGNLGMSQLGRVEYALTGGAVNTDFIDNAGGVDCSDHEVNIKICLDELAAQGQLSAKQRSSLLQAMTQEVADLVLQNVARQTQALSLAARQAAGRMAEYQRFMQTLEDGNRLNRALEFLPSNAQLAQRQAQQQPLTRPELAVLMSYAKVMLKEALVDPQIYQDPYLVQFAQSAFPAKLVKKYPEPLSRHRLLPQLVATQLANDLVNNLGITAASRLAQSSGASLVEVAKAYVMARDLLDFEGFQDLLSQSAQSASAQLDLLAAMNRRLRRMTRWFLRNRRQYPAPQAALEAFSGGFAQLIQSLHKAAKESACASLQAISQGQKAYKNAGWPQAWAQKFALPDNLFSNLGVLQASLAHQLPVGDAAVVFYQLQDALGLGEFANALSDMPVENIWQAQVRESYLYELEQHICRMVVAYLQQHDTAAAPVASWLAQLGDAPHRWQQLQKELRSSGSADFAVFAVAMGELADLARAVEVRG